MQYEIRAMSLGEILDTGFRIVRDQFGALIAIGAVLMVPLAAGTAYLEPVMATDPGSALLALVGVMVFYAVLSPIVGAAITHLLGEAYLGRTASVGSSLRLGLSLLFPLVGTQLLAVLLGLVGLLLLVVPGIYLFLGFMVLTQVMVIERRFGIAALRRSHELMQGHRLRVFGLFLLSAVLTNVLSFAADLGLGWLPWVGPVASGLAQAVGLAFLTAVLVLLYFDVRCRKEAFDLEHLSRVVEQADGGAPVGA
ncbi:MAG: hypothetical protein QNK03_14210 [Myxococcota bacterium]|nr:hypothetical protein [Myxococcota bacterium]